MYRLVSQVWGLYMWSFALPSIQKSYVIPFERGTVKTQDSRALTSSWLYVHLVRLCKLWHVDVNLSHICRWLYQSVISFQNKFEQKKTLPTVCKPTRPASFQICLFTWAVAVLLRLSKRDSNWMVPVCSWKLMSCKGFINNRVDLSIAFFPL